MGDVLHTATDFVGLTDYEGQQDARDQASQQADRSYNLTTEEIAFQRSQYEDWKSIYGGLQEDIGTYYKNLTGSSTTAQKLVIQQKAFQDSQSQIDKQLVQRGLGGSGLDARMMAQNVIGNEQAKATIRATADQESMQQKIGFLGLGLGQGTQMLGINAGVSNSGAGNAASMSSTALSVANSMSQANMGVAGSLAGTAIGIYGANGGFGTGYSNFLMK